LSRAVAKVLASAPVDVIIASTVYTAETVRWVTGIPKVVDFMDVYSEFWRARGDAQRPPWSWADRIEAERLARYEAGIAREFDGTIFVSEAELALFKRRVGPVEAEVVGNGVDLEYFQPADGRAGDADSRVIVFTGSMDYSPNVNAVRYFCSEILPLVRSSCPDVRFLIVGRNPNAAVRSLARDPAVTITGTVPDVRPYLAMAAVAVAPFQRVQGVQNKILEAMAMGLPVVSSSSALEGLGRDPCEGLRRADEPDGFASELVMLLEDPNRRARLGRSARRYVERWHRWEDLGRRLDHVLSDIVNRRTAPRGD
jgi:sugar transferase (PEP-CTERM/EpsH1 system associated)